MQQLKRIGTTIADLNRMCDQMRKDIEIAHRETAPILEEASNLMTQIQAVENKQQLLDAFNEHFIVSEEDLTVLTSLTTPVGDQFFHILARVKGIRKDCEVLLGTEDQSLGMELMEQTSLDLDAAFKKLYTWIQHEFKAIDLEDPQINSSIRKALRFLAERPTLFQNCLDFFAEAREHALSDAFHMALTKSATEGSTSVRVANPIELQTHDLLRYIGDMLAWVHSTTVSEREALEGLFISADDEIAKEIQAGRDSEPWSRIAHEGKEAEDSTPAFDGRKALNELVNRDLGSVAALLKQRVEISVRSNDDPVLVYKVLNLFQFYQDIFSKLVGTPSILGNTIAELQTSISSHFERLLQDETAGIVSETIPEDLSTPPFLLRARDHFKSFLNASPGLSGTELSQLLSTALVPSLDHCSKMASTIQDATSQCIFQLNYLFTIDNSLQSVLPPNHGFLLAAHKKVEELKDDLAETQHSFLQHESGIIPILNAIQAWAEADASISTPFTSLPVFQVEALSTSAAQLDNFLPSALMDLLNNVKLLLNKGLAKDVAHEAAERFYKDFEVIEEAVLRADEESQERRAERGWEG